MKNTKRNWITTLFGILTLFMTGLQVAQKPETVNDPQTMAQIAGGVGLIAAKDGNKTGIVPPEN